MPKTKTKTKKQSTALLGNVNATLVRQRSILGTEIGVVVDERFRQATLPMQAVSPFDLVPVLDWCQQVGSLRDDILGASVTFVPTGDDIATVTMHEAQAHTKMRWNSAEIVGNLALAADDIAGQARTCGLDVRMAQPAEVAAHIDALRLSEQAEETSSAKHCVLTGEVSTTFEILLDEVDALAACIDVNDELGLGAYVYVAARPFETAHKAQCAAAITLVGTSVNECEALVGALFAALGPIHRLRVRRMVGRPAVMRAAASGIGVQAWQHIAIEGRNRAR